jgi:SMODS-associated and fused to various effectors sensor domain
LVGAAAVPHDPNNLMLVCDAHHRVFDREMVHEHPEEVLVAMKRRHEARIRTVDLAVFGLAPIPLLFERGRLTSDIATADVRQFLRDPKGWKSTV